MIVNSLLDKKLWSKELVSWYLYDLAISMVFINLTLYFSEWVVVDNHFTDFWFSLPFILATIVLIFISSYVGRKGDTRGWHFKIFMGATTASLVAVLFIFLAGRLLAGVPSVVLALIFFGLYQLFMQLAFVPYYSFIKHISTEKTYGRVSGIGFAFGQLGNLAGILLTLPVINGQITIFGADRLSPLIPVMIAFIIFALPSYFAFRNKKLPRLKVVEKEPFWKSFVLNLKRSRDHPGVLPLLISFYLFSDAIQTIILYSSIYLQKVFSIPDSAKAIIFIVVLLGFILGAAGGGVLSDRLNRRLNLIVSLIASSISIMLIALNGWPSLVIYVFFIYGLSTGWTFASSRSYFAYLIPKKESGTFFGLYTFAERVASVVGPAIWGIIIFIFVKMQPSNYRVAAFVMGLIVLSGVIPLIIGKFKK
ncbi:MAG: MFS transporter [archaeon]